jgi:hypothetical protein
MEESGQIHAPATLTSNKPSIPIGYEVGWALEPVWTLRRREKSCKVGNRTWTVHPIACRFIDRAIPTSFDCSFTR